MIELKLLHISLFLCFFFNTHGVQFVEQSEIQWTDPESLIDCLEDGRYLCLVYVASNLCKNCPQMNEIMTIADYKIRYVDSWRKNIADEIKISHIDCNLDKEFESLVPECADFNIDLPRMTLYEKLPQDEVIANETITRAQREQRPFDSEQINNFVAKTAIPRFNENYGEIDRNDLVEKLLRGMSNARSLFEPSGNKVQTFIGSNPYWNFEDTYILGNDLVEKYVKSFYDCGKECQDYPGNECHAFTYKNKEPVKGMCSLKKAPSEKDYTKRTVREVYHSAIRSAQSFPTCQGNSYGPNSVFDRKTEKELHKTTGCWSAKLRESGKYECIIENPQCVELSCNPTFMTVKVRKDAFENPGVVDSNGKAATFILNNATRINEMDVSLNECTVEAYNGTINPKPNGPKMKTLDIYNQFLQFDIPLDDCGMEMIVSDKQISFLMSIDLEKPTPEGDFIQNFHLSHRLSFMCSFSNEVRVYKRTRELGGRNIGMIVTRDFSNGLFEESSRFETRPEIVIYETAAFKKQVDLQDTSRSMSIGRNIYFKIVWDIGLTLASPVVFYAQNCRVSERDVPDPKYYDIVWNGRGSRLTSTKLRSPSVFAKRELRFSFRSFVFNQGIEEYNMDISCNINFCVESSMHTNKCRYTKTINAEPDDYYEEFEPFPEQ